MKKHILQKVTRSWAELHPDEIARFVEDMPEEEKMDFFQHFNTSEIAPIMNFMHPVSAAETLNNLPADRVSPIMEKIPIKKAFLVYQRLSPEMREQIEEYINRDVLKQLTKLSSYPPNSIGLLVNPQVMTIQKENTVRDVIRNIHKITKTTPETIYYLYVTDSAHHLLGLVNIRDLLLSDPAASVEQIMNTNVVSVRATRDQEDVVSIIKKHNFVAIPIVDEENHLLGVVPQSDILPMMEAEASDDIQKMFGAGEDERVFSTPWYSIKKRLPWLHVNLITAFVAAMVVSFFESTIARITILAVLLPVVAGQSGNTGAQVLAVVIRGLALKEVGRHMIRKIILKELMVGAINGLIIGLVTGLIVFAWMRNFWLALSIGIAMIFGMVAAVLTGALIPIGLKAIGYDPAQSSSIILTTVTDVLGFGGFLLLAQLFINLIQPMA